MLGNRMLSCATASWECAHPVLLCLTTNSSPIRCEHFVPFTLLLTTSCIFFFHYKSNMFITEYLEKAKKKKNITCNTTVLRKPLLILDFLLSLPPPFICICIYMYIFGWLVLYSCGQTAYPMLESAFISYITL